MSECLGLQSHRNHNFQITHSSQTFLQVPVCNVIYAGLGSNLEGGSFVTDQYYNKTVVFRK